MQKDLIMYSIHTFFCVRGHLGLLRGELSKVDGRPVRPLLRGERGRGGLGDADAADGGRGGGLEGEGGGVRHGGGGLRGRGHGVGGGQLGGAGHHAVAEVLERRHGHARLEMRG